jgi:prophage regulatory protein
MVNTFKPKIYFIKDAEQVIGRNRQTLRRWWEQNNFPKPTLIANRLAWQAEVIEHWINQNVLGVQNDDHQ